MVQVSKFLDSSNQKKFVLSLRSTQEMRHRNLYYSHGTFQITLPLMDALEIYICLLKHNKFVVYESDMFSTTDCHKEFSKI